MFTHNLQLYSEVVSGLLTSLCFQPLIAMEMMLCARLSL